MHPYSEALQIWQTIKEIVADTFATHQRVAALKQCSFLLDRLSKPERAVGYIPYTNYYHKYAGHLDNSHAEPTFCVRPAGSPGNQTVG